MCVGPCHEEGVEEWRRGSCGKEDLISHLSKANKAAVSLRGWLEREARKKTHGFAQAEKKLNLVQVIKNDRLGR